MDSTCPFCDGTGTTLEYAPEDEFGRRFAQCNVCGGHGYVLPEPPPLTAEAITARVETMHYPLHLNYPERHLNNIHREKRYRPVPWASWPARKDQRKQICLPRAVVEELVDPIYQPFIDGEYNRCIYCDSSKRTSRGTGPIIHDDSCPVRVVQEALAQE